MDADNDDALEEADLEEVEKNRIAEGDETEYGQTNEAGKKVNMGIVFDNPSAVTTAVAVFPVPNP